MQRKPDLDDVREALSELYLDTDLRPSLPRIAATLAASGLRREEVVRIWREELTPILHWNLLSAAGEWASFDREWLLERIRKRGPLARLSSTPVLGPIVHWLRPGSHLADADFRDALAAAFSPPSTRAQSAASGSSS